MLRSLAPARIIHMPSLNSVLLWAPSRPQLSRAESLLRTRLAQLRAGQRAEQCAFAASGAASSAGADGGSEPGKEPAVAAAPSARAPSGLLRSARVGTRARARGQLRAAQPVAVQHGSVDAEHARQLSVDVLRGVEEAMPSKGPEKEKASSNPRSGDAGAAASAKIKERRAIEGQRPACFCGLCRRQAVQLARRTMVSSPV